MLGRTSMRRRLLLVRVTELEDHFRIAHRKAVNVRNAPAQDEGVVIDGSLECPENVISLTSGLSPDFRPR